MPRATGPWLADGFEGGGRGLALTRDGLQSRNDTPDVGVAEVRAAGKAQPAFEEVLGDASIRAWDTRECRLQMQRFPGRPALNVQGLEV